MYYIFIQILLFSFTALGGLGNFSFRLISFAKRKKIHPKRKYFTFSVIIQVTLITQITNLVIFTTSLLRFSKIIFLSADFLCKKAKKLAQKKIS